MSQFAFLQREWSAVFDAAGQRRKSPCTPTRAPPASTRAARWSWRWRGLYKHDAALKLPYQDNLSALIHEPSFKQAAGEAVFSKARVINDARQPRRARAPRDSAGRRAGQRCASCSMWRYWLARTYGRAARPAPGPRPSTPARCPRPQPVRGADCRAAAAARSELCASATRSSPRCWPTRPTLDEELQAPARRGGRGEAGRTRRSRTRTTTPRPRPATTSSTCCSRKPAGRSTSRGTASSRSPACPTTRARASSITCCGATTASRSGWSRPSARDATRASASSRPSSTPTAWRSSSASGRSSSTRTATSTGSGTTRATRRARCRVSTRRPSWNC